MDRLQRLIKRFASTWSSADSADASLRCLILSSRALGLGLQHSVRCFLALVAWRATAASGTCDCSRLNSNGCFSVAFTLVDGMQRRRFDDDDQVDAVAAATAINLAASWCLCWYCNCWSSKFFALGGSLSRMVLLRSILYAEIDVIKVSGRLIKWPEETARRAGIVPRTHLFV